MGFGMETTWCSQIIVSTTNIFEYEEIKPLVMGMGGIFCEKGKENFYLHWSQRSHLSTTYLKQQYDTIGIGIHDILY